MAALDLPTPLKRSFRPREQGSGSPNHILLRRLVLLPRQLVREPRCGTTPWGENRRLEGTLDCPPCRLHHPVRAALSRWAAAHRASNSRRRSRSSNGFFSRQSSFPHCMELSTDSHALNCPEFRQFPRSADHSLPLCSCRHSDIPFKGSGDLSTVPQQLLFSFMSAFDQPGPRRGATYRGPWRSN